MKKALNIIAIIVFCALATAAQNSRLTSKMLYHNGPLLPGVRNIYTIYYGCWDSNCGFPGDAATPQLLADFITTIGGTPYMRINSTYTDASGQPAASSLIYGGQIDDSSYSHGVDLTPSDVVGVISDLVNSFRLPQDPNGIYIIIASADVASTATGLF